MNYITVDFEWNQASYPRSKKKTEFLIQLDGEIIQIGAVKMDENFEITDTFEANIHPVFYRKINKAVKKLTGINQKQLNSGDSFEEVIAKFKNWCGKDHTFLTWGPDDSRIMIQNLLKHRMDTEWMGRWINLQAIYNVQTNSGNSQVSLKTALEKFEIPQILHAHNAINDAMYACMVCKHLDLKTGIKDYYESPEMSVLKHVSCESHKIIHGLYGKISVFAEDNIKNLKCPHCNKILSEQKPWIKQNGDRYLTTGKCETHGAFVIKLKIYRLKDKTFAAKYDIFSSDGSDEQFYLNVLRSNSERIRRKRKRIILEKKQSEN
ncbi:MAG: exonuclease domain-containing protein [Clostridia bacterium]|nr:exonuclease domain-containing protein [Clostridia bacterium]